MRGVVAALVGVVDHPARRATALDGHLQGFDHEFAPQVRHHGPPDHPPTPDMQNHRQVKEPRPGGHVGDVGDPEPGRVGGAEVEGSGAAACEGSGWVVATPLRRLTPTKPASRISRVSPR